MNWLMSLDPTALATLVAVIGAYFGLKHDNTKLADKVEIAMLKEREYQVTSQATAREGLMASIARVENYVKDLTHRVSTLESGQDEWTKSLRQRTHELANDLNSLVLKVDRLERPKV